MTKESLYTKLINKFESGNSILFLGAGVSYNSGIPLVKDIYNSFWDLADLNQSERAFFDNKKYSFEFFMHSLKDGYDISNLFKIFGSRDKSNFHTVLHHLVKEEYCNTIITTNFDYLIEETLKEVQYQKFVNENITECKIENSKVKILKLHGCITNPQSIKIAINNVASHENKNLIKSFFANLATQCPQKEIIFWGYSFSDFFDIEPALREYIKSNKITILNHRKSIIENEPEDCYNKSDNVELFNLDSDDFVSFLNNYYNLNSVIKKEFNWKKHFNDWANQDINSTRLGTLHGISKLSLDLGNFKLCDSILKKALKLAKKHNSELWIVGIKTTMSSNHFLDGNYFKSFLICKWLITNCEKKKHLYPHNLYLAYLNYTNILTKLGRYKTSLIYLEKAKTICEEIGFKSGYFKCLCNIGLIMDNLKKFDYALMYVIQSIEFSEQSGEYSSLCNRYGYLAEIYYNSGNIKAAEVYIEKALQLSNLIGEKSRDKYLFNVYTKIMNYR